MQNLTTRNQSIAATKIASHVQQILSPSPTSHDEVLEKIYSSLNRISNFTEKAGLANASEIKPFHFLIVTVEEVIATAKQLKLGLAKQQGQIFAYNGIYWRLVENEELEQFLGRAADKLGIDKRAKYHRFRAELRNQFMSTAYLPPPKHNERTVLINFLNGTLEITNGLPLLREHRTSDFMTYVLPFNYDPQAAATKWRTYLDQVLPDDDRNRQNVLAEYIGYCFTSHLKLEKVLLPYGSGSNGKSVFFDVIRAMFGEENICYYSLTSLHNEYYRAKIAGKLLNYSSEISSCEIS